MLDGVQLAATSPEESDLVVIGGGPGGYAAAIRAAQLGMKVTCVDKRGSLGGTCVNVGCTPSKALLESSHMYDEAQHSLAAHGVKVADVEVDLPAMMAHKTSAVAGLAKNIEALLKKNKVTYLKGHGKIVGPNQVAVSLLDSPGETKLMNAKNIIIATGSDVQALPGVPIDEKKIVSSTGALSLPAVPNKLVVLGGGAIGLELGSVWGRLGAEVTVVEVTDSIGGNMDREIRRTLQRTLEKQGFKFMLATKVVSADASGSGVVLQVEAARGGQRRQVEADVVLVATGRVPYTDGLGLDAVGVRKDKVGRIVVDGRFRSSVPSVFAIGDVISGPMLAHKAEADGIACVDYIVGKNGHVDYGTVPWIIYTHPEVAMVGKTEEDLKQQGVDYRVGKFPFTANSRARTTGETEGMVKMIAEKATDRVVGVHIVGQSAGELIMECVVGMEYGASSEDIARMSHGHPTLSEAVKEAALATYSKPIHM
ncbi:unnamed protein product [Closterium sp. NIES-64]|nr:unnamed protein product [Closterium sp. NIES-64]CAI5958073.1 unnamed protein product [Closterium sp. NIES-65]CAI5997516.1 unnamed protein product [Closterium sp. NIES-65]CAI6000350.1 unnamed protein product [Closterium sp. NIES-64]